MIKLPKLTPFAYVQCAMIAVLVLAFFMAHDSSSAAQAALATGAPSRAPL